MFGFFYSWLLVLIGLQNMLDSNIAQLETSHYSTSDYYQGNPDRAKKPRFLHDPFAAIFNLRVTPQFKLLAGIWANCSKRYMRLLQFPQILPENLNCGVTLSTENCSKRPVCCNYLERVLTPCPAYLCSLKYLAINHTIYNRNWPHPSPHSWSTGRRPRRRSSPASTAPRTTRSTSASTDCRARPGPGSSSRARWELH